MTISLNGANIRVTDPNNALQALAGTIQVNATTVDVPLSSVTGNIQIATLDGLDTLTVDLASGDPIPPGNLTLNTGAGTADALIILGGNQGNVTYNYDNSGSGNIVMQNFGTVFHAFLDAITNFGAVQEATLRLPGISGLQPILEDDGQSNTLTRLRGSTITNAQTDFANPAGGITLEREGTAAGDLAIHALPDFSASLTLGSAANPWGTIQINGGLSLASGKNVSASAATIIASSPVTTAGGAITLRATGGITLHNALTSGGGAVSLIADSDGNGTGTLALAAPALAGFTTQQQLTAADGAAFDEFGHSVALSGDGNTAIAGARLDDIGANFSQGTATVFTRTGPFWTQQQQLTAAGGMQFDSFGFSVALSNDGNTAIVGAVGRNTNQGAAMVFTRAGAVWTQQQELTVAGSSLFGRSVALSSDGNTAVVGGKASAVAFSRSGAVWIQQQQLVAPAGAAGGEFGVSVALSADGNTALVGANLHDIGANIDQGSANVFTRSGTVWTQQQQLTATGGAAGDEFGISVALSSDGNTAIVGANLDDVGTKTNQGSATVFTRSGTVWTQQQQLVATGGVLGDQFGASVALSGDGNTAIVGAAMDSVGASFQMGSATVFGRSGNVWTPQQQLGVAGTSTEFFGVPLALSSDGKTTIAASSVDDVGANSRQGSAHIFVLSPGGSFAAGVGAVSISAADVDLQGPLATSAAVSLASEQSSRPINLGSNASNTLGLTDAELDRISTGSLTIGNASSGAVTISAAVTRGAATVLNINSGAAMNFTGGSLASGGAHVTLNPGTSLNPASAGVDIDAGGGTLAFGSGDDLLIAINGATVDTQYQQLNVVGEVNLAGLDLVVSGNFVPSGQSFVIVNNDGVDPIQGTFNGLPEGATIPNFLGSGFTATISYTGGTGNDVVISTTFSVAASVDDGDGAFATVGSWFTATDQGFQGDVRFISAGSGANTSSWTFNVTPGRYRVAATWSPHVNRTTNAPFTLLDGSAVQEVVPVNQELPPDDFSHGGAMFEFVGDDHDFAGGTIVVHLSDAANQWVIADGVVVVRLSDLAAAPEIQVFEGMTQVPDGGSFSFGMTLPGTPVDKMFRVRNGGNANLTLQPVTVPPGFTVINDIPPNTVLASGGEISFSVRMLAASAGNFSGDVSFANTDGDENPFNLTLSGTASAVRIIDDGEAGFSTTGSWLPFAGQGMANDVHYAAAGGGSQTARWTFPITPGQYELAVTWTTHGNRATDAPYTVKEGSQSIVFARFDQEQAPNDFTDAGASWERLGGTLNLTGSTLEVMLSDDASEYVIADAVRLIRIGNLPSSPEIQVFDGAAEVADGTGSVNFGATFVNVPVQRTFRVKNTGSAPLTLQPVAVTGDFSIISNIVAGTVLATGGETTFTVQHNAGAVGPTSGQLSFSNDDADENPFNFAISGTTATARIMDNGDPGFSTAGFWSPFFGEGFQADVHYTSAGTGALEAIWTFAVSPGQYRVAATWSTHANRATNAPFTVFNGSSPIAAVTINQEQAPNDLADAGANWEFLGGVLDITATTLVVKLADLANEYVIADAIRLERVSNPPAGAPPQTIAAETGTEAVPVDEVSTSLDDSEQLTVHDLALIETTDAAVEADVAEELILVAESLENA